ncbi:MAG TPA: bifunctional phosphoglucose/phosphomannose isomerase [Anaerolineae bacterium]|nr:bifunctional phosphoglucose/phosphomannose isomerase [Anaerolineae bacterium]
MFDLNNVQAIRAADTHDMLGHVADLPQQLIDGWAAAEAIDLPPSFREIDRVVLAGMGGLASGGALFAKLVAAECQLPITVVRDYDLPAYAHGAHTLVIATSYSGDTEETLAAFEQAVARGCQVLSLTANGQLLERAKKQALPLIRIDYQSPSRSALGWSVATLLNVASRLGWTHHFEDDLEEATRVTRDWTADLNAESPVMHNLAKREAGQLMGRMVYVVGAGIFAEVARRWRAQIAVNADTWAAAEFLPEANHYAIAGLQWPDGFATKVMALFLTGQADHPRNAQRVRLTRQAYMIAGCNTDVLTARGESSLAQMLSLIMLGDFMSVYLALLHDVDPSEAGAVTEFKVALGGQG